ncbi:hypothetical protein TOPH_08323 [Tolypocladium ophioglossoides CBS 100239]|uniref:Extracellular membrane protein CFEM domain-containing protein n=1 Tax=Tolypocladium ophioglossoides (strain CBS 100239) TaxID=1163406 RepID=A0A0L0MZX1_TOLOC|nr:hypothetical protein TOPH_08323 [Tolypocladium ophioglossoides CBS 100239]
MRTSTLFTAVLANALGATALEGLSGYVGDVPSCAYSTFAKAMSEAGCATTSVNAADFDCICKHMGSIAITVARGVDVKCSADFTTALGSFCGVWIVQGTTATDLPAATSILAAELAGQTPGASATSGSASAASPTGATSKSTNIGVAPSPGPGVVGLVGGAVALAGFII